MINRLKKINSNNWILIAMILGIATGIFLNLFVDNPFIKDFILMDNVFYFGGNLFIRLMKMLVVPLILSSIVMSLASISDIRKFGTIGGRSILFYILLSTISLLIAFIVSAVIEPGVGLNMASAGDTPDIATNLTITEMILNIIPENPVTALTNGEILHIIIFGLLIGFILVKLKEETQVVNNLFKEFNRIMMLMTEIVMKFAPVGIFCLMARVFGTLGFESIIPMTKLIACLVAGVLIMTFIVYPIIFVIFTKSNPLKFYKKYLPVILFAFSSASSNATIPLHIDTLEEIGIPRDISSFTIPLGTSLNQNGIIIMFGVGVMFAAQAHGIHIGTSSLLTISLIILITSISAPAVPMTGIFSLNMIFNSVGIPVLVIDLIMGIYNILDMFITIANVTGNGISTALTTFHYKSLDMDSNNHQSKKT